MIGWCISASILILAITLLRYFFLGKVSLRLQYALWGLVLLRLLVPMGIGESRVSVMNFLPADLQISTKMPFSKPGIENEAFPTVIIDKAPAIGSTADFLNSTASKAEVSGPFCEFFSHRRVYKCLWLGGMGLMTVLFVMSNVRFAANIKGDRCQIAVNGCPLPVYESKAVMTPCLFGNLSPAIYVTPQASAHATTLSYVVEHEMTHFRHRDHFWSFLRCVCLCLHWYNPLVWLAAILSARDSELACDEATIRRIGEKERFNYGRALISLTCTKSRNLSLLCASTTIVGGKCSIKERITLLAKKPQKATAAFLTLLLVVTFIGGCTLSGPRGKGVTAGSDDGTIVTDYKDVVFLADNSDYKDAARIFVRKEYPNFLLGLPKDHDQAVTEYNLLEFVIEDEVSSPEVFCKGQFACWIKPMKPDYYIMRGGETGTGIYEGILFLRQSFSLERIADGHWTCVKLETNPKAFFPALTSAFAEAQRAFEWFELSSMPISGPAIEIDGNYYHQVEHETIKNYAQLQAYLRSLFAEPIVRELLDIGESSQRYRDIDGVLYGIAADRGGNIYVGGEDHEIVSVNENRAILRVTVEIMAESLDVVAGYESHDFVYEKIDDRWVFTNFYLYY